MALSALQKAGVVLGFIPVVSTPVGFIKLFVYFYRKIKHEGYKHEEARRRIEVENNAKTTHETAVELFKNQEFRRLSRADRCVFLFSMGDLLPVVNIVTELISLKPNSKDGYAELSKAQENIEDENGRESRLKDYLLERYGVENNTTNSALMAAMEWIFINLDEPSEDIDLNTDNRVYIWNQIPELVKKCREKSEGDQRSCEEILVSALEEIIEKRQEEEKFVLEELKKALAFKHLGGKPRGPSNADLQAHSEVTKKLTKKLDDLQKQLVSSGSKTDESQSIRPLTPPE